MNAENIILETPRLLLREMTTRDAEQAYLLNLDPEVIRYTGDKPFDSIETARRFLEQYDHYKRYGFGRWAVIRKDDGMFLGWCGLKYSPDPGEYDIGFRLFRDYWNRGYATEAATACLRLGFEKFDMPVITGHVMPANTASSRVLVKCGLTYREKRMEHDAEVDIYEIRHADACT